MLNVDQITMLKTIIVDLQKIKDKLIRTIEPIIEQIKNVDGNIKGIILYLEEDQIELDEEKDEDKISEIHKDIDKWRYIHSSLFSLEEHLEDASLLIEDIISNITKLI